MKTIKTLMKLKKNGNKKIIDEPEMGLHGDNKYVTENVKKENSDNEI